MNITNPPKALIALVGLVCLTVLLAVNAIPTEAGTGMIGSILGMGSMGRRWVRVQLSTWWSMWCWCSSLSS